MRSQKAERKICMNVKPVKAGRLTMKWLSSSSDVNFSWLLIGSEGKPFDCLQVGERSSWESLARIPSAFYLHLSRSHSNKLSGSLLLSWQQTIIIGNHGWREKKISRCFQRLWLSDPSCTSLPKILRSMTTVVNVLPKKSGLE